MTNTDTADVAGTVAQVAALARAGSEMVRITVDRDEAAVAAPALAVPILDGGWSDDVTDGVGLPTVDSPYVFVLTAPAYLRVVDCCVSGDTWFVTDFGSPLLTTAFSFPTVHPGAFGDDLTGFGLDTSWVAPLSFTRGEIVLLAGAHSLSLSTDGVQSSTIGDLAFMTPISELKFNEVTKSEAEAYQRWRDGYQTNWRWAFDPIALRLSISNDRLASDVTVMPLIAGSEYGQLLAVSRGASISPSAGDRHDALLQLIISINTKSTPLQSAGGLVGLIALGMSQAFGLTWADAVGAAPRCKPVSTSARTGHATEWAITFLLWTDIVGSRLFDPRRPAGHVVFQRACADFL
jgi:hypothetical protein